MKLKHIFIIIVLLSATSIVSAQNIIFTTTQTVKGVPFGNISNILETSKFYRNFKGIPNGVTNRVVSMEYQKEQGIYEKVLQQNPLNVEQVEIFKQLDTTLLSTAETKHRIYFLIYFDGYDKVVVPDINMDYDFSNDKAYRFEVSKDQKRWKKSTSEPFELAIQYEYYYNDSIVSRVINTKLEPILKNIVYRDINEGKFHAVLVLNEYKKGVILIGEKTYHFVARSANGTGLFKSFDLALSEKELKLPLPNSKKTYTQDDSILIDQQYYYPSFSLFGDTLFLKNSPLKITEIINKIDIAWLKNANKIKGTEQQLQELANCQYVVYDFWGTWCSPCLKDMPKMKKLHEKYSKKCVGFVGIAVDNATEKVKDVINQKGIDWLIINELNVNSKDFIHTKLSIQLYPTYILCDKNGSILLKTNDIAEVEKMLIKIKLK